MKYKLGFFDRGTKKRQIEDLKEFNRIHRETIRENIKEISWNNKYIKQLNKEIKKRFKK